MNILIVDDDPIDQALMLEMLKQTEHVLFTANTGKEALATIHEQALDLIFVSVTLKDTTGFEIAKSIREHFSDLQSQIIYISTMEEAPNISIGLDFGDDFIIKPIDFVYLKNKLNTLEKKITTHQQIYNEHKQLQGLKQEFNNEKAIVREIFSNVVKRNRITGSHLKFIVTPTSIFSGDIVLTKQVEHTTYLLMGDFTGHGLPAAIGLLPTANTFFTMVDKGLSVGLIAAEINRAMLMNLPEYMFLAATLVSYDTKTRICQLWSGGMPETIHTNADGQFRQRIKPDHMALGAMTPDEFDNTTIDLDYQQGDNLILYTNGIIEARNKLGEPFGEKRFLTLVETPNKHLFQTILQSINMHTEGVEKADDISIAEMTLFK